MRHDYRIELYWLGRDQAVKTSANGLYMLLTALRGINEGFAEFRYFNQQQRKHIPISSKDDCAAVIEAGRGYWRTGQTQRTAYKTELFIADRANAPAQLWLTCGIDLRDVGAVFVPNSLSLRLTRSVASGGLTPAMGLNALRAAVNAFRPLFGLAASSDFPPSPKPLFSKGTPAVGWMTFLSAAYPALPANFAEPTRVHTVGKHGHIVVAHPYMFDDNDDEHRAAVARVAAALHASGVLLPVTQVC